MYYLNNCIKICTYLTYVQEILTATDVPYFIYIFKAMNATTFKD